jgi:hypothetical protein
VAPAAAEAEMRRRWCLGVVVGKAGVVPGRRCCIIIALADECVRINEELHMSY